MASVQPGDLIEVNKRLRRLMAAYDNAGHVLEGSFRALDPELELLAQEIRPVTDSASTLIYQFLTRLEKSPAYLKQRADCMEEKFK